MEPVNYPYQLLEEDLVVYLFGDWELNPTWPAMLSRLRVLANRCAVKMFVARDVLCQREERVRALVGVQV